MPNSHDQPTLYRALIDAHLSTANKRADEMREHLRLQVEDVLSRFSAMQSGLILDAYAQGVRDGFSQGVVVRTDASEAPDAE